MRIDTYSKNFKPEKSLVEQIRNHHRDLKGNIKKSKLGLVGIILLGALSFSSCGYNNNVKLPNNYVVKKAKKEVTFGNGSTVFKLLCDRYREMHELVDKSRMKGVVSYIGFLKTKDKTISVNNINQKNIGGDGGFILSDGGNAKSNVTVFDHGGIIIKFKPLEKYQIDNYILQLKTRGNEISPAIALEEYKKGDTISIPTINVFKESDGDFEYRTLKKLDFMYLGDIKKVN